jgi:uncharacterized membrane protein YedE/YeeE
MMSAGPWYLTGPLIGVVIVALRAAVNRPLGAMGGYIELARNPIDPTRWTFDAYLLLGIAIGGAMFAVSAGSWSPTLAFGGAGVFMPADPFLGAATLFLAGMAMGVGARTAGGCTSGHGLCGISLGSPASVAATVTFFVTAVLLAHLIVWLSGGVR